MAVNPTPDTKDRHLGNEQLNTRAIIVRFQLMSWTLLFASMAARHAHRIILLDIQRFIISTSCACRRKGCFSKDSFTHESRNETVSFSSPYFSKMRLTHIFPLTLLAGSSSVLGECFKSGPRTGYANDNNVLDLSAVCSLLTGLYNKGEFRRICVHDKNGIKWDFELKVSTLNFAAIASCL